MRSRGCVRSLSTADILRGVKQEEEEPEENVQTSFNLSASVGVEVSGMCLLTTRRAGDREQRWRDGSRGSLGAYWWDSEGGGAAEDREYVFCCSNQPRRINSWHEHNVSPSVVPGSMRKTMEFTGSRHISSLRQRPAPTCHKHPVIWPHPSA